MQSIIVYRNPLEAAFWNSPVLFPVFVACVFFLFCTVVLCNTFGQKYTNAALTVSAISSLSLLWFML